MAREPSFAASVGRFTRRPDPDAAVLADIRKRYDAGEIDVAGIAGELGLSPSTIGKRLGEWGWRKRAAKGKPAPRAKTRKRTTTKAVATVAPRAGRPPESLPLLLKRLLGLASRYVEILEQRLPDDGGGGGELEGDPRVLASLVKLISDIARLQGRSGTPHDSGAEADDGDAGFNHDPAAGVGGDLARLKSDLVERLARAVERADAATDSGDAGA
jgi:hypothetical protein